LAIYYSNEAGVYAAKNWFVPEILELTAMSETFGRAVARPTLR